MGPFEEAAQTPAVANPAPAEAAREGRQGRGEPAVFPVTRASGMRTLPTSSAPPHTQGGSPLPQLLPGGPPFGSFRFMKLMIGFCGFKTGKSQQKMSKLPSRCQRAQEPGGSNLAPGDFRFSVEAAQSPAVAPWASHFLL